MSRSAPVFDAANPTSPLSVPPSQTALLLMDYQGIIVGMAAEQGPGAVAAARSMRDWALRQGIAVFHCTVGFSEGPEPSMRLVDRWPQFHAAIAKDPALGAEVPELKPGGSSGEAPSGGPASTGAAASAPAEAEVVRRAGVVSALRSHGLMDVLRARGVRSLVMGGISTSGCVLSTVRAAVDEAMVVTVVKDACCDPVPELHALLMAHAFSGAHVASAAEIQEAWKR